MSRVGSYATCAECGRNKQPRGRDSMDNGLCDRECPGYDKPPYAGDLWPGETAEEFGYSCWTTDEMNDPFGPVYHNKQAKDHSGKRGHYCVEWDGLWICEDCEEFDCCECWSDE